VPSTRFVKQKSKPAAILIPTDDLVAAPGEFLRADVTFYIG
jgi:hypothetical protein